MTDASVLARFFNIYWWTERSWNTKNASKVNAVYRICGVALNTWNHCPWIFTKDYRIEEKTEREKKRGMYTPRGTQPILWSCTNSSLRQDNGITHVTTTVAFERHARYSLTPSPDNREKVNGNGIGSKLVELTKIQDQISRASGLEQSTIISIKYFRRNYLIKLELFCIYVTSFWIFHSNWLPQSQEKELCCHIFQRPRRCVSSSMAGVSWGLM